jgi:hypothetical protein
MRPANATASAIPVLGCECDLTWKLAQMAQDRGNRAAIAAGEAMEQFRRLQIWFASAN